MNLEELVAHGLAAVSVDDINALARNALRQSHSSAQLMQHPLGFFHVRLLVQELVSIRLHYWPGGQRPQTTAVTPYHDHVWALQSCILAGHITNVLLSLETDETGPYVVAKIAQVGGVDSVVPTPERVRITREDAVRYSAGDRYTIPPRAFHYTDVAPGMSAVTIVRAEVIASGGPRTLVPSGYSGQAPARTYVDQDKARGILEEIDRLLV